MIISIAVGAILNASIWGTSLFPSLYIYIFLGRAGRIYSVDRFQKIYLGEVSTEFLQNGVSQTLVYNLTGTSP